MLLRWPLLRWLAAKNAHVRPCTLRFFAASRLALPALATHLKFIHV
jgi:hypothetical protein